MSEIPADGSNEQNPEVDPTVKATDDYFERMGQEIYYRGRIAEIAQAEGDTNFALPPVGLLGGDWLGLDIEDSFDELDDNI